MLACVLAFGLASAPAAQSNDDDKRAAILAHNPSALTVSFDRFGFARHLELRRYTLDDAVTDVDVEAARAVVAAEAAAFGVADPGALVFAIDPDKASARAVQLVGPVLHVDAGNAPGPAHVGLIVVSKRADAVVVDGHFWPKLGPPASVDADVAQGAVAGRRVHATGTLGGENKTVPVALAAGDLVPKLVVVLDPKHVVQFVWRLDLDRAHLFARTALFCGKNDPHFGSTCSTDAPDAYAVDAKTGELLDDAMAECLPQDPPTRDLNALLECPAPLKR